MPADAGLSTSLPALIQGREAAPPLLTANFRRAMGQFTTGVAVVTACGDRPHGITVSSFASVSLDPPMVLVCLKRTARINEPITLSGCFGVSVLSQEQADIARYFADRGRYQHDDQFTRFSCSTGRDSGVPLLDGSLAQLECQVAATFPGGDHHIYLGRTTSISTISSGSPLTYFDGRFTSLAA